MKIAIVVVAFNRPKSLERLLYSLNNIIIDNNDKITLHISIDRKLNDLNNDLTIDVANRFVWKFGHKIVDVKEKNFGLKKHVLYCGNLSNKYQNIIVLEDDIVVSPLILKYAKQVINFYDNDEKIAGYGMYSFQRNPMNNYPFFPLNDGSDVYFLQYACSWGQLWSKDKWNSFFKWYELHKDDDFSKYDIIPEYIKKWGDKSWLKYHIYYCILNNKFFVYPHFSFTSNFTDVGTHNKRNNNSYQTNLVLGFDNVKFKFRDFFSSISVYDSFFESIKLNQILNIDKEVISDVYGEKNIIIKDKYLLSSKMYDFKIVSSYSLKMYPIEHNLMFDLIGDDLFLFDLSFPKKNFKKGNKLNIIKYFYKLYSLSFDDMCIVFKNIFIEFLERIFNKVKKCLRKYFKIKF